MLQTVSARAADADGENTAAEVALSDDERTVLVSQRGDDTVATLGVDGRTARLVSVDPCGGSWPRWAGLVGGAAVVANERSDAVVVLRREGYGWAADRDDDLAAPDLRGPAAHPIGAQGTVPTNMRSAAHGIPCAALLMSRAGLPGTPIGSVGRP